ncbi:hypothetical protein NQT62_12530 [Limnobacter humi]|uniref:Response regulatory domain-containing protein n=1 Tax=Limnobacter humi TaxID=1778671 RepID=A0ABT1WJP2_9BURK|nr:hypothetical protein [Limnobacter humi]MCQ8897261.1 hypothetical protein [Limnobacter humi]
MRETLPYIEKFALMHSATSTCVVLSDYPIKAMGYLKFLASLGEFKVTVLDALPEFISDEVERAKLVVVDMNWATAEQDLGLERALNTFPNANVLFMQEDHTDLRVYFENNRDICLLGKQASLSLTKSLLSALLLHANEELGRPERSSIRLAQEFDEILSRAN